MAVWLARDVQAVKPTLPYSLATSARLSASTPGEALTTVSDGAVPADASDRSVGYFPLEPLAEGADAHWLQYDFPEATFVRSASIHWVDDAPGATCACRVSGVCATATPLATGMP